MSSMHQSFENPQIPARRIPNYYKNGPTDYQNRPLDISSRFGNHLGPQSSHNRTRSEANFKFKPFNLQTNKRGEQKQAIFHSKIEEEEKLKESKRVFKASAFTSRVAHTFKM